MSNMRIITGSTGTTHVTSQDDRSLNACIYSQDNVVFNIGSKFAHTVVDNNTIIIADGDLLLQGCHARIDYNLSEEVAIDTGALGMKRVDFICARYSIDTSTGYESVNLHVVKGTASASEYVDPEVEEGLLREGAQTVDFPLYRVKLNGINIEDVEQLFTPQSSLNSNLTENYYTKNQVDLKIPTIKKGNTGILTVSTSPANYEITFANPMPDTNYVVNLTQVNTTSAVYNDAWCAVHSKTVNGFSIRVFHSSTSVQTSFDWVAID